MRQMTMPAKLGWGVMTALVVVLALFGLRYFLFGREAYFELNRQSYLNHEAGILLHIGAMMIGVLMGPMQFLQSFRDQHRRVHRTMGKVYLVASTIGGFSGMYMAFYTYADAVSSVSFFLLGTSVVLSNYMAYTAIRRRDITTHREWMTRSFALMLAAVALRIEVAPLQSIFGEYTGYAIVAWACWVPNLAVAEWAISQQRQTPRPALQGNVIASSGAAT